MVGSHCAEYFSNNGFEILVYDNLMRSEIFGFDEKSVEYNWNYLMTLEGIRLVKADIRDVDTLRKVFANLVRISSYTLPRNRAFECR